MILDTLVRRNIFDEDKVKTQIANRPCGLRDLQFSSVQEDTARFLESCLTFKVLNLSNKGIDSDWTSNVLEIWASYDCVQLHPPSSPTQDGEAGCSSMLGAPTGQKLASLWGLEKGSSWSNTISFLPVQRRTIELPQGKPFRVGQCGVCLVMGMEDY